MTKKQMAEFEELFKKKFHEATTRGVIAGFKAAYEQILTDIDSGMTIEELRTRIVGEMEKSEVIEQTKFNDKVLTSDEN